MITVVIKPRTYHWLPPTSIRLFETHAIDFDPTAVFDGRPEPREKDGVVTNADDIAKYDRGWRMPGYQAEVTIPFEALTRFLPCEVLALHGHITVDQVAQRDTPTMNTRVKVVTPGAALQEYDEVMVEGDCCTDHLQNRLNDGWRILAICVQPDQRRPDYILGRRGDEQVAHKPIPRDVPRPMPPPVPHVPEVVPIPELAAATPVAAAPTGASEDDMPF